jgi:hypothetical protein
MANVGIEQLHYFCPRKKKSCSLVLYYSADNNEKIYKMIECDNKLDCKVYIPSEENSFNWEFCPAYSLYNVI